MQAQSEAQSFDFEYVGSSGGNWIVWGLGGLAVVLFIVFFLWFKRKNKSDEKIPRITE